MRVTKGRVIGGRIVVEGEALDEGSSVTILLTEARTFTLSQDEEDALLDATAEADRGELVDAEEVLNLLPNRP